MSSFRSVLAMLGTVATGLSFGQQWSIQSRQPEPVPTYQASDQRVVWISGPAGPGDSVVLTGAFSAAPKAIKFVSLNGVSGDWRAAVASSHSAIKPLSQAAESLTFEIPSTLPAGAYAFRVSDSTGTTLFGRVNLPEVYWTMGLPSNDRLADPPSEIEAAAAIPGGILRVFGRSFGPHPELVLKDASGKQRIINAVSSSEWQVTANIPPDIGSATYELYVRRDAQNDNTLSAPAWIKIAARPHIQSVSLDLQTCGLTGDGIHDDSGALQTCLNQNSPANGTLIAFFQGKSYVLKHPTRIPPHVYLKGWGTGKTVLKASGIPAQQALFTGSTHFGISQLTIDAPNVPKVIASDQKTHGHILIDHVAINGVDAASVSAPLPDTDTQIRLSSDLARGDKDTVSLAGDDIRIMNSQIVGGGRALILANAHAVYLSNDLISDGPYGWYTILNSTDVIFERSRINGVNDMATGGSYTGNVGISENIYTDGNSYERMPAANGEAFTSDGPGGAYFGLLASAAGTQLQLAADANWQSRPTWLQASVAILGGRGAGQYRLIKAWNGRSVELEQPFDITPDQTSVVTVVPTQRHYILVNNRVTDAGVGLQFYGTIFDSVIANNTLSRAGGIFLHSARYGDGIQPNLFVQILDNTILRKGTFKGGEGNPAVNDAGLVQVQCAPPSLTLGIVVRGNKLGTEAAVNVVNPGDSVRGAVVEKNAVSDPQNGLRVQHPSPRVIVRHSD